MCPIPSDRPTPDELQLAQALRESLQHLAEVNEREQLVDVVDLREAQARGESIAAAIEAGITNPEQHALFVARARSDLHDALTIIATFPATTSNGDH